MLAKVYLILRRKLVVIVLLKLYRENNENKQKEAHFFKKKKIRKEALSILNLIFFNILHQKKFEAFNETQIEELYYKKCFN